jgi:hypothetical protein
MIQSDRSSYIKNKAYDELENLAEIADKITLNRC